MALPIPCTPNGVAFWIQRTAIAGRDYELTFRWNQRDGHWYLDLADENGSSIVRGISLVAGYPLLRGIVDERRPPGELAINDTTNADDVDPGFSDLGTRFELLYFTPEELA